MCSFELFRSVRFSFLSNSFLQRDNPRKQTRFFPNDDIASMKNISPARNFWTIAFQFTIAERMDAVFVVDRRGTKNACTGGKKVTEGMRKKVKEREENEGEITKAEFKFLRFRTINGNERVEKKKKKEEKRKRTDIVGRGGRGW